MTNPTGALVLVVETADAVVEIPVPAELVTEEERNKWAEAKVIEYGGYGHYFALSDSPGGAQ